MVVKCPESSCVPVLPKKIVKFCLSLNFIEITVNMHLSQLLDLRKQIVTRTVTFKCAFSTQHSLVLVVKMEGNRFFVAF